MNKYECIFVARQDITTGQVDTMSELFSGIVKNFSGNVLKVEYCGLRQLAYKIKKNRKGHYVEMHFECAPDGLNEMERQMGLHEDILRFLTIKVEEFISGPSPLSQTKGFKEAKRVYNNQSNTRDRSPTTEKPEVA
jgi:small subunit ribosomal protein S6